MEYDVKVTGSMLYSPRPMPRSTFPVIGKCHIMFYSSVVCKCVKIHMHTLLTHAIFVCILASIIVLHVCRLLEQMR